MITLESLREAYQGAEGGHDFKSVFNERGEEFDRFIGTLNEDIVREYAVSAGGRGVLVPMPKDRAYEHGRNHPQDLVLIREVSPWRQAP